jgi:hypothetical protein
MKVINLFLINIMKIMEIFYTFISGVAIVYSFDKLTSSIFTDVEGKEVVVYNKNIVNGYTALLLIIWFFTMMHNHVIVNLRLGWSRIGG